LLNFTCFIVKLQITNTSIYKNRKDNAQNQKTKIKENTGDSFPLNQSIGCFGRVRTENHQINKNWNHLIWNQFRATASSICSGVGLYEWRVERVSYYK
jgi:hypothetical protein